MSEFPSTAMGNDTKKEPLTVIKLIDLNLQGLKIATQEQLDYKTAINNNLKLYHSFTELRDIRNNIINKDYDIAVNRLQHFKYPTLTMARIGELTDLIR
jgi:hypothetical protein